MGAFLIHAAVLAVAIWISAQVVSGITIRSVPDLIIAALVLGVVNAVIRPLLVILTLPITVLTLGLFYLVVNGLAFGLAAALVPGFEISSWTSAILGALLVSVVSWFLGIFVKRD
jgi:putative membrane protein